MADTPELKITLSATDNISPTLVQATKAFQDLKANTDSMAASSKTTSEGVGGLNSGLLNLHAGVELLETGLEIAHGAFEIVKDAIEACIEASVEGERSFNQLAAALVATGNYSKESTKQIEEYAHSVQLASGVNQELVQSHVAVGVQMGLSIERSEELEAASRKLSVLMGGDVNAAFDALKQSLAGHARGIQVLIPALKDMGTAQLQNGAAIDYVNSTMTASESLMNGSFSAAVGRMTGGFKEILKNTGDWITQSDTVKSVLTRTGEVFGNIGELIHGNAIVMADHTRVSGDLAGVTNDLNKDTGALTETLNKKLEADSKIQAAHREARKEYDDMIVGTQQEQKILAGRMQDQQKEYAAFKKFYDDKLSLAVSSDDQQEQQATLYKNKILMTYESQISDMSIADTKRRQDLNNALNLQLITQQQHDAAMGQLNLKQEQAKDKILQTYKSRQNEQTVIDKQRLIELQAARSQGLITEQQYNDGVAASVQDSQIKQSQITAAEYTKRAQLAQMEGNTWAAMLAQIRVQQAAHGQMMGALQAIQNSEFYKGENTMLTNLSSLRSGHSQTAFELGKDAAIAQATIQTFLGASEAFTSMAGIPYVGPILGAAAAAAAIASGLIQVQNIEAQQFTGGQADEGMDSVPSNLSGKSFVLSAGEAVIQPQANKDLRDFLSNQKGGTGSNSSGGTQPSGPPVVINMTVNGNASKGDMSTAVKNMIDALRKESEKGRLIISSKGVY